MTRKEKEIKKNIKNALFSSINSDMFEYTLYTKDFHTCEEIGNIYIKMMTEIVNELISTQNLYLDYTESKEK